MWPRSGGGAARNSFQRGGDRCNSRRPERHDGLCRIPHLVPKIVAGKGERGVIPYLIYFLAGPVAEGCVYGKAAMERGYQLDVDDAQEFAIAAMCDASPITQAAVDRIRRLFQACGAMTDAMVNQSLNEILLLADALIEQHALSNNAVKAVIGDHLWKPPIAVHSTSGALQNLFPDSR